ncbi:hypothetical protein WA026_015368 [Henosepilachna vigintioctopunctata]|uniref:SH2 domain-containing protein n=1 Tax=Henosepilachna vigintioctopunctata TaxID=420089 RepID=A0AAW1UJI6_9CUCU
MCWCLRVSIKVFRNLISRVFSEFLYCINNNMCLICCCSKSGHAVEIKEGYEEKEPRDEFYKNISREKAEYLLENRQDGTFIIRPSKNSNLGALSLVQDSKVFHLNIRSRDDNLVALGIEKIDEKTFKDIDHLINYYISNYLVLYSDEKETLTLLLPYREKIDS